MTARITCLESYRSRRLTRVPSLACVHAEARPGLLLIHVPTGWSHVSLTTRQARVWLEQIAQLIETADELDGGRNV